METVLTLIPLLGILGIVIAVMNYLAVKKYDPGNEKMVAIADKIHAGAMVFLRREYMIIAIFMAVVFIALAASLP